MIKSLFLSILYKILTISYILYDIVQYLTTKQNIKKNIIHQQNKTQVYTLYVCCMCAYILCLCVMFVFVLSLYLCEYVSLALYTN